MSRNVARRQIAARSPLGNRKRHSREERHIGALQRRQAGVAQFGADAPSARQTAWPAATTIAAASNSRQSATPPSGERTRERQRARVARLSESAGHVSPRTSSHPGQVHRVCPHSPTATSTPLKILYVDLRHSIAPDERAQAALRSLYRRALPCGIMIPHMWWARRSLKFMPKRGIDADSRIFFDELAKPRRVAPHGPVRSDLRTGMASSPSATRTMALNAANASASPIRNSRTAAHGPISFVQDAAAGKRSSGSSTTRRAA